METTETMETKQSQIGPELINELIKELSEFNRQLKNMYDFNVNMDSAGHFTHAFSPVKDVDESEYYRNIRLISNIHDILNESDINVKSRGYTYMKDAICIIVDHANMDICLCTDIYPYIAQKHGIKNYKLVEHNIRNALNAAYKAFQKKGGNPSSAFSKFGKRLTNKAFLLYATQEIHSRLCSEACTKKSEKK